MATRAHSVYWLVAVLLAAASGVGAQSAIQDASLPAAQNPFTQVIVANPLTPEQEGDTLMSHQRYQAAIAAYRRQATPSAPVLNKLGIAHQMMFNMEEASRSYQASLRLDPKNPHVLNNLGTIYDSMKMYGAAERMYRKALKAEPKSALVYKNLGTNLLAQHKTKKGYEAYKAAAAIDPGIFTDTSSPRIENPASIQDRGAMNYYMARACVHTGQFERAVDYLRNSLNEGFITPKKLMADNELAPLHGLAAFEQLLAAQRQ